MCRHVGLMVLLRERLKHSALKRHLVLFRSIHRLRARWRRQDRVDIADPQSLVHLPVGHVEALRTAVDLRVRLHKLQLGLRQSNPLSHREDVRVADRQNVNTPIKVGSLDLRSNFRRRHVGIRLKRLREDPCKQLELNLLRVVQPLVDRRHHLRATLHDRHGRANRRFAAHLANLHVSHGRKAPPSVYKSAEKVVERGRGLLERQRHQSAPQIAAHDVNIAELARLDRRIVLRNARALGLEATGQVGQRPSVDKLPQERRGSLRKATNHVRQPKAVETKAGEELVVDEILVLTPQSVLSLVIPPDRKDLVRLLEDRDDVRQLQASFFAIFVHILEPGEVQIGVNLVYSQVS